MAYNIFCQLFVKLILSSCQKKNVLHEFVKIYILIYIPVRTCEITVFGLSSKQDFNKPVWNSARFAWEKVLMALIRQKCTAKSLGRYKYFSSRWFERELSKHRCAARINSVKIKGRGPEFVHWSSAFVGLVFFLLI